MGALDERRLDADVDCAVGVRCDADEPDDHAELRGGRDVRGLQLLDTTALDVLEADTPVDG